MRRQVSRIGQLGRRKGLSVNDQAGQAGRGGNRESTRHRTAAFGNGFVAIGATRIIGIRNADRRLFGNGRRTRNSGNQRRPLDGVERTAAIRAELIGLRAYSFDDAQQFDEGVAFVAALRPGACSRVFEQIIQVAARLESLGDFLEILRIVGQRAVGGIRRNGGGDFGIDTGCFARADTQFTAIGKRQHNVGALGGDNAFALANHIAQLEAAHVTCTVAGKSLTGQNGNLGDDLGLCHDLTPHTN